MLKRLAIFSILILSVQLIAAQLISPNAAFKRYTSDDGLSQQVVRSIVQDQEGFIWIGTEDGLNKFDGYEFKQYRNIRNDHTSLPDNFIYALCPSADGSIWIGTKSSGIARFDPVLNSFKSWPADPTNPNSLKANRIYTLYEDSEGILWIGTYDGGLSRFDPKTEEFVNFLADGKYGSLASNMVTGIQRSNNGTLWVRTSDALQKLNETDRTFTTVGVPVALPNLEMRGSFYIDTDDIIWTSIGASLLKVNAKTEEYELISMESLQAPDLILLKIIPFNDTYLWISTNGNGLLLYHKQTQQVINFVHDEGNPTSIMKGGIISLLQDRSGSLWAGGIVSGISKLNINRKKFTHFKSKPGNPETLSGNTIRALLVDSKNNMWVGYMSEPEALLDKLVYKEGKYLRTEQGVPQLLNIQGTTCLMEDSKGNIWIGTWGDGAHILPGGNLQDQYQLSETGENPLSDNIIQAFFEDRFGNIWIGTEEALDLYNPLTGQVRNFRHDPANTNSLAQYGVQANTLVEDAYGNMWVGTWGGLTCMIPKDNTVNSFDAEYDFVRYLHETDKENTISDNRIISLYYDPNINPNEIFAGTYGSGMNRIIFNPENREDNKVKIYSRLEGLPNDVVYSILSDESKNLWISTNNGLASFNPKSEEFVVYDVNDGLQGNQFFWGARTKGPNGELLFGGINGFNMFFPAEIESDQTTPAVAFTDLKVLNHSIGVGEKINNRIILKKGINHSDKIVLTHRDNVFTIEFAGLHYAFPDNNRYRYMMEGFDENWIEVDSRKRFASYTNLDHGKYVFKVDASNYDGVWTGEPREIQIVIKPPFWKGWWFRILVLLIMAYIAFKIYERRTEGVRRDKELLEGKIREGELIIAEKVKEVEKQQEEIRKRDIEEHELRFSNEGLAKFSNILTAANENFKDLSRHIISELVDYVGAAMGALYIYHENSDGGYLELFGSYALDTSENDKQILKVGEGYVGTCFAEGKTIAVNNLPDGYFPLTSGLGEVQPGFLYLVPAMQLNNKQGIIEIASLEELEAYKIRFIEKIGETLTSVISIRKTSVRLNELLEQSHQQTEELRSQEEEMRQNMEEMYATQEEMSRREEEWKKEREDLTQNKESLEEEIRTLKAELETLKTKR